MARTFENPINGYRETVDSGSSWGAFFFGFFYLLYKGLWAHALLWFLLVVGPAILSGGPLLVLTLPIGSIAFAASMQGILAKRYLKQGWKEVQPGASNEPSAPAVVERDPLLPRPETKQAFMRQCPFCAEEIRLEAIKCKHCQSDVSKAFDRA